MQATDFLFEIFIQVSRLRSRLLGRGRTLQSQPWHWKRKSIDKTIYIIGDIFEFSSFKAGVVYQIY